MNPRSQLVPVGEALALGELPTQMHAYVIRAGRFGVPTQSFVPEVIDVWIPGPGEVLVRVMAAGVNFNGIWAGLGSPVNILANHGLDLVVPGSDASGVVWAIGEGVTGWKVGDEVVLHCNHLLEPGASDLQTIWGYETPDGAFAQFTRVQSQQLLRKPPQLSWEEAASYGLTYYTAHRMLVDRAKVQPGEVVLVWVRQGP
ncbi:MAG: alcohol dehydrogenase catalytic domain-containing protein, partial [Sandaracinaceae bacterium]|nr:alcohol dehydrogenase catalytic domain-containing protein [Sandaracinaceae bacterium]